jgi:hypothetical protein
MADSGDQHVHPPQADRAPTPAEEQAAERALPGVDVSNVREHVGEMNQIGANVQGEGEIEPDRTD